MKSQTASDNPAHAVKIRSRVRRLNWHLPYRRFFFMRAAAYEPGGEIETAEFKMAFSN